MLFDLRNHWVQLHWATRLCAIAVIVVLLGWQSRNTSFVRNPMFGWPMPFTNLWYRGSPRPGSSPSILILDCAVWLLLAGSTGYVVEMSRRQTNQIRLRLRTVLGVFSAVVVLVAIGCTETYFREHPGNDSIFPRYGRADLGGIDVWLDIGLFTDPIYCWPLTRIVIVFSIGCAVYTANCLLYELARRIRSRTTMGKAEEHVARGRNRQPADR